MSSDAQIATQPASGQPPLIVDLDGTLARTDTLHEAMLGFAAAHPMRLFEMVRWLKLGKAQFKDRLASEVMTQPDTLPLNEDVLALIRAAKAEGREVHLVSASDHRQVEAVADHVDLFDSAMGSDRLRNLSGQAKADWLVETFGAGGFDYAGDNSVDLAVWSKARRAITVGADDKLRGAVEGLEAEAIHISPPMPTTQRARVHLKALRPHQWLKNLLVFVPALAAHDLGALGPSLLAFFVFCLTASSIYLINDMLDLDVDRRHPRKCKRPFAAGTIPVAEGGVVAIGLLTVSAITALILDPLFFLVMLGYVVLTTAYSLVLKRRLMVDIWALAALYTTRIIAGGVAADLLLSGWLLAFSMFIFLSLAAVKRQSELADLKKRGLVETDGRAYHVDDLPVVLGAALASGYCSVLVLALYISNTQVTGLYETPSLLWLVCPLLLYWISRTIMISWRGKMDDDPILFAVKDRVSLAIFATSALLFVLGAVV